MKFLRRSIFLFSSTSKSPPPSPSSSPFSPAPSSSTSTTTTTTLHPIPPPPPPCAADSLRRVAIVGAGIAGLTTALALVRTAHIPPSFIIIYEPRVSLDSGQGAGLNLNSGAAILAREYGINLTRSGRGIHTTRAYSTLSSDGPSFPSLSLSRPLSSPTSPSPEPPKKKKLFDIDLSKKLASTYLEGTEVVTMLREDLQKELHDAVTSAGVKILRGGEYAVEKVTEDRRLMFVNGAMSKPFDLVVGADGVRSRVRDSVYAQAEQEKSREVEQRRQRRRRGRERDGLQESREEGQLGKKWQRRVMSAVVGNGGGSGRRGGSSARVWHDERIENDDEDADVEVDAIQHNGRLADRRMNDDRDRHIINMQQQQKNNSNNRSRSRYTGVRVAWLITERTPHIPTTNSNTNDFIAKGEMRQLVCDGGTIVAYAVSDTLDMIAFLYRDLDRFEREQNGTVENVDYETSDEISPAVTTPTTASSSAAAAHNSGIDNRSTVRGKVVDDDDDEVVVVDFDDDDDSGDNESGSGDNDRDTYDRDSVQERSMPLLSRVRISRPKLSYGTRASNRPSGISSILLGGRPSKASAADGSSGRRTGTQTATAVQLDEDSRRRRVVARMQRANVPAEIWQLFQPSATSSTSRFIESAVHEHAHVEQWWINNIVLVGDAAHAMGPFLGQGANQTIQDAHVLALKLGQCSKVEEALQGYEGVFRTEVRKVASKSRVLGYVLTKDGVSGYVMRKMMEKVGKAGMLEKEIVNAFQPRFV